MTSTLGRDGVGVAAPYVAVILAAIIAGAAWADDFLWLEREWISDADATMAANPQLNKLDDSKRAKFKSIFGEMRWRFADGIFEINRPGAPEPRSTPYFIRPIDEKRFEIVSELDDYQSAFVIWRTDLGFCTRPEPEWIPDDLEVRGESGLVIVECFKPYGA
jgi:hypothetical protein